MKKLLLLASLVCGGLAIAGGIYGRLQDSGPSPTVTYYGDGQPRSSICYLDGHREGPSTQWYSNGQIEAQGEYRDGFRAGEWSFWNEDGTPDVERSGTYDNGRKLTAQ